MLKLQPVVTSYMTCCWCTLHSEWMQDAETE